MAQSFARFGSQVFLVEAMHGVLPNEDTDASEIIERSILNDGVQLLCCGKELHIKSVGENTHMSVSSHGQHYDIPVDEILVSVGRSPNTDGLLIAKASRSIIGCKRRILKYLRLAIFAPHLSLPTQQMLKLKLSFKMPYFLIHLD